MNKLLPIKRSKNQARRYYNRLSRFYDVLTASEETLIQQAAHLLVVKSNETLLEIGCGTGRALQTFSKASPAGGMRVGLDLSRQMLLISKANDITPAPQFIQADGTILPLKDAGFDAIFIAFTLELFSEVDIHAVLSACHRVLKPKGRLGIAALAESPRTFSLWLYELTHRFFPVAVDCRPIPLIDLLEKNGFQLIQAEKELNWGLPIHLAVSTKRHPTEE
jgi:demethylmenaquinone methyltransferase/2-methoxy-6-polyprenyl-1,4-benzoquinol methylase